MVGAVGAVEQANEQVQAFLETAATEIYTGVSGELVITDPQVVIKSYPGFWDDLAMAGFKIIRS